MINSDEEYAILVDKNDQVIGSKKRKNIKSGDCIRITGVWIENNQDQVLIAQRSSQKKLHPNLWGPTASGGVEKNESYEENAYKELYEEVGLNGIELKLVTKSHIVYAENNEQRYVAWFKGVWEGKIDGLVLEDAVAAVKWVSKDWLLQDLHQNPDHYVPSAVSDWERVYLS